MTVNLAAAAAAALDAGAVAALSVPHGIFALKEEQRTAEKFFFFPQWNYCSGQARGLGKSSVNHSDVATWP